MNTRTTLTDITQTLDNYDTDALSVVDAQKIIRAFVTPVQETETINIHAALGRTLAEDIISPINVPAHDNAAMDGYALRASDLDLERATVLQIIGIAYAGHSFDDAVDAGECVRIMTGALMPLHCDTVVPQEFTHADLHSNSEGMVSIPAKCIKHGDHRRLRGEDLAIGKPALRKGKILRPADLGLLASLGIGQVTVTRKLRVAFFSTGDELRSIGEGLDPGCIYDSNRYTIYGMLKRLDCDLIDMGIIKDDPASLEIAYRTACDQADVIITSGGVSVGDADYIKQLMSSLGEIMFWKIAMRPGRPMAFGTLTSNGKSAYLFGLPGNPVAVMVSFYFFVRDALLQMMGSHCPPLPLMRAQSVSAIKKKLGRTEFQRGILSNDLDGNPLVQITGAQGSGILRSMSEANCIVVLQHAQSNVVVGDVVDVILFDGLC